MKLTYKQIEPFIQNPDKNARAILIYGPDSGLMAERSKIISLSVVSDLNDPFNVATLPCEAIIENPSVFYDEANAQSLMGGDRLVVIKNTTDGFSAHLKDYLDSQPSAETLIVIEAGDLGPKSSLRKLCESAKNAAAVPCYVDDERNISQIIRDMCMHAGYRIDQDALMSFAAALVGDRIIARNEIEKLILYKGYAKDYSGFDGEKSNQQMGQITMQDIVASCGDVRDWSMDTLIYAIADGDPIKTQNIIQSLFADLVAPIVIMRSVQNHFWRLFQVQSKIKEGLSQEEAVNSLNPKLFWKVKNQFMAQLRKWHLNTIEQALDRLNQLEIMSKQTGYSDQSLVEHTLVNLARYNRPRQR